MSAYYPTHGTELDGAPGTYTCRFGHDVKTSDATNSQPERPRL